MKIVVDASVALKWVLEEPGSEAALRLRQENLVAPALWLVEAANVLWLRVRIGDVDADEAAARYRELVSAPVTSLPNEPLLPEALQLATKIAHPVYDCLYLALALREDSHVVTADRRFARVAERPELANRVRLLVP